MAQKSNVNLSEATDEVKAELTEKAKNSIKFALILDSIRIADPTSDLTDEEVINMLKARLANQVQDVDAYLMEMQKNGQLIGIVSQIRNETTLQYLIDNAKLID